MEDKKKTPVIIDDRTLEQEWQELIRKIKEALGLKTKG